MNTNSTTPRPCAGCSRDLGFVMRTFAITYDGWRYEVCGHTDSCANRLMARLSRQTTTTTSATNDTERDALVAEVARLHKALEAVMDACDPECYGCGAYYVAKEALDAPKEKP